MDNNFFLSFETLPKFQVLKKQIAFFENSKIKNPYFREHDGINTNKTLIEGKEYLNFAGYNYLGFSGHPEVQKAAIMAIKNYGCSASAGRIASANLPVHNELEKAIADLIEVEDCVIYVAGYMTNESTIGYLMSPKDLIVYDELAHRSILTGCIESGARRIPFPHNNFEALDSILERNRNDFERTLIIIEGIYSMDGDVPHLPSFIEIKKKYSSWLMIDEAHSLGTLGETGRGIGEYYSIENKSDVDIWMGTVSKAFASCGGYIAGSKELIKYLKSTSPGCIFSTAMPPPNAAAALASIKLMLKEPERVKRVQENGKYFLTLCQEKGLNTGTSKDSAIVPIYTGSSAHALYLVDELFKEGICVIPILYPAVADSTARLRFFITSEHTKDELKFCAEKIAEKWAYISKSKDLTEFATIDA